MGIFDKLKNAILGTQLRAGPVPSGSQTQPAPTPAQPTQAGRPATQSAPAQAGTPQAATGSGPGEPVDIELVLNQMAARKQEKLNWQSSIVDLMKLVDLDPGLENRKTLAKELGYTGDTQDSATMNIWLHREVMQKLAASGGRVPDSLRH